MAIFVLWIAMFQKKGCWAISRQGKTEEEYEKQRNGRQVGVFLFVPLSLVVLTVAMSWLCQDGCADGTGDGQKCLSDHFARTH
jgi:hypothetical protein